MKKIFFVLLILPLIYTSYIYAVGEIFEISVARHGYSIKIDTNTGNCTILNKLSSNRISGWYIFIFKNQAT
jgi:hypothetical protein